MTTITVVETSHFPIYLQTKDKYFKVQLENNLYRPVWDHEYKTKALPSEHLHYYKTQQLKPSQSRIEIYPIIQVKFGITDILVADSGNAYSNGEFTHFCRIKNVQFKLRIPYAPRSNGLVENSNW